MIRTALLSLLFTSFGSAIALADETPHAVVTPADIKWVEAPPTIPAGAKLALLQGDPARPGFYVFRLMLPANYRLPVQSHPAELAITVVSGTPVLGTGDKVDPAAKTSPAGSFMPIAAKTNHYVTTKKETVLELSGVGPFAIAYANPDEDPNKGAAVLEPKSFSNQYYRDTTNRYVNEATKKANSRR